MGFAFTRQGMAKITPCGSEKSIAESVLDTFLEKYLFLVLGLSTAAASTAAACARRNGRSTIWRRSGSSTGSSAARPLSTSEQTTSYTSFPQLRAEP